MATKAAIISATATAQVYLHDWWLIKAQSKGLAVGGFASTETQGVRAFCSAAISIRHDANTLKTIDGITITVSGFINRSRTHQNGFSYEVCNHFHFGFPYYWKEYAAQCFGEESHNGCVPRRVSAFDEFNMSSGNKEQSFPQVSLDDLPMTRIRDLLMSTYGDSDNCVLTKSTFNDILGKFSDKAFQHTEASIHSKNDTNNPSAVVDSVLDETLTVRKKAEVKKCKMGMDVLTPGRGVATRSMTRLMNVRNNQDENPSLSTSMKKGVIDVSSSSKVTGKQCRAIVTKRSASAVNHGTILCGEENEVRQIFQSSAVRRSSIRLKNLKK